MRIISQLFAFVYLSNRRRFLGFSISTWLKLLPFILIIVGAFRGWPVWTTYLWLVLWLVIIVTYWVSGRAGYTRFIPDKNQHQPSNKDLLPPDKKINAKATGIFSISDREDYVLFHPAQYWRAKLGQHIFMVAFRQGTFRYQIIKSENIQNVKTGYLLFGAQPKQALALTFLTTWGPSMTEYTLYYVEGNANPAPSQQRTIYLTFDNEQDLHLVRQSLALSELKS